MSVRIPPAIPPRPPRTMATRRTPVPVPVSSDESSDDETVVVPVSPGSDSSAAQSTPPTSPLTEVDESSDDESAADEEEAPRLTTLPVADGTVAHDTPLPAYYPRDAAPALTLFPHQHTAIEWGRMRERTNHHGIRGGVIGADMGLGKTLIFLSLCDRGLNLVICPKPLLDNAYKHLARWFPSRRVLLFHRDYLRSHFDLMTYEAFVEHDVILTTYEVVTGADRVLQASDEVSVIAETGLQKGKVIEIFRKRTLVADRTARGPALLYNVAFDRIVMDEGHRICNHKTKGFKAVMALYSKHSWISSGTPIRNSEHDLWALMRWLGYEGAPRARDWNLGTYYGADLASVMMNMSYADAKVVLPPLHRHTVTCRLEDEQRKAYEIVREAVVRAYNGMMLGNVQYIYVLALFTRLRQMCIAAHLITPESKRGYAEVDCDEQVTMELDQATDGLQTWVRDVTGTAGLGSSKLRAVLETIRSIPPGEKFIVFSTWTSALDLLETAIAQEFHVPADAPTAWFVERWDYEELLAHPPTTPAQEAAAVRAKCHFYRRTGHVSAKAQAAAAAREWHAAGKPAPVRASARDQPAFAVLKLDGATTNRDEVVHHFTHNPQVRGLLASYKVGGEGLTLTAGTHALLLEPWWNTAVPAQAEKRIHRLGQLRDCHVYNFVAEDTIETAMVLAICDRKDGMARAYLGGEKMLAEPDKKTGKEMMGAVLMGNGRRH